MPSASQSYTAYVQLIRDTPLEELLLLRDHIAMRLFLWGVRNPDISITAAAATAFDAADAFVLEAAVRQLPTETHD